jgi:hypothetical protein
MMVSQQDILFQREHYKDLLKQAEQERLLAELRAESAAPSLWSRLWERLQTTQTTSVTTHIPSPTIDTSSLCSHLTEANEALPLRS